MHIIKKFKQYIRVFYAKSLVAIFALFLPLLAKAEYVMNLSPGVTPTSQSIYALHMIIFWICVVIGVAVFGVMFYSIFYHRKSRGAKAEHFHESAKVEVLWTAIPAVILVAMAIPASKVLIDLEALGEVDMTVKITGLQWKWQYEYPEEGISFVSNLAENSRNSIKSDLKPESYLLEVDKPLILPAETRIRFLITSNDVIHNWWVPAFGVKQDANPGFINDAWAYIEEEGTYYGRCAELCGKDHGFMPVVVKVLAKDEYQSWVEEMQLIAAVNAAASDREWTLDELVDRGQGVYNQNCAVCHGPSGAGLPGVFPAITGSSIATGSIAEHIEIIFNGKAGTAMQAFKSQLDDADIASVITFQRNGLGNNVGDLVQPNEIGSMR